MSTQTDVVTDSADAVLAAKNTTKVAAAANNLPRMDMTVPPSNARGVVLVTG
jgi:hypothetical protein